MTPADLHSASNRPSHRWWLAVIALTAAAFLFRFYRLADLPPGLHYDEAFDGLDAYALLSTPLRQWPIFFTGNFGREPLFMYLLAASQLVFGPSAMSLRLVPALMGALLTPALVWLAWEMAPSLGIINRQRLALWSGAAVLALLWTQIFARYVIRIEVFALIVVLIAASLWRAWRRNRWRWWGLAGILAGLSFYTYLPVRLLPLVFIPVGVLALWRYRSALRQRLPGILLASVLALLVAAPLAVYFVRNPLSFSTRTSQVSILGQDTGVVAQNAEAVLGMAFLRGDANPRNNIPGRPALDWLTAIPFLVGLGFLLRHALRPAALFLLSWLGVLLLPTLLSEYAPSFQRAIGAVPVFAFAIALGLEAAVSWGGRRWRVGERHVLSTVEGWLAGAGWVLLVAATLLTWRSFASWAASSELFYARDSGFAQLAPLLANIRGPVYLSPRGYDHPTVRYLLLAESAPPPDLRGFDGRVCVRIPSGAAAYYFLSAEDFRGPGLLASYLPDAIPQTVLTDPTGQPWATTLEQPVNGRVQFPEMTPSPAEMDDGIHFLGYWLSETNLQPGARLYVRLFWQAQGTPRQNYTTFVHLLAAKADGSFERVAGVDAPPGNGSCPTAAWQPGETVVDELQFELPSDLAGGEYFVATGLYNPETGQRVAAPGHPNDEILLGPFPANP